MLVICNGVYGTAIFTWPFQVGDCIIRTSLRTLAALLTFRGVNMGAFPSSRNCAKFTCADTSLANTVLTIFCHSVTGNRTVFTCRTDYLDDISVILPSWRLAFRKTNSLPDNLSLFVDTAAELRRRTWDQLHCNVVPLGIQLSGKGKLCHFM